MLSYFRALVPSERPAQLLWQGDDSAGDRVAYRLRAVPCTLERLARGHSSQNLDQLMPWNFKP
jgi:hypothetical protein